VEDQPLPADPGGPKSPDFAHLIARICQGDRAALEQLVQVETPRLMRRVTRRIPAALRRRIGASDIVQMTLAELAVKQDQLEDRGIAAFRRLVVDIADAHLARACARERAQRRDPKREQRPRRESSASASGAGGWSHIAGSVATPSKQLAASEDVARIMAVFPRLSPEDQQIIRWIDYEELEYADVAARLGLSVKTAQKRHSRAIAALRALLKC
jgi:RNA polymerase sigma factor (sigma-70 family)